MEVSGEEAPRRELITRYIEASAAQEAVDELLSLENEPVLVNGWIDKHMNRNWSIA